MQKKGMCSMKKTNSWRLQDVLLIAMLGLIFSLVYMAVFQLGLIVQAALTPVGLGVFGFEIIYGIWFMAGVLAAMIIQKPGVAFAAELLASIIELLLGNAGGTLVVITGVIQGLGTEVAYLLLRYRKWGLGAGILAALTTTLFTVGQSLYLNGYASLSRGIILAMIVVRVVSAVVFAAFICWLLARLLAKTGVLRSYPLGAAYRPRAVSGDDDKLL